MALVRGRLINVYYTTQGGKLLLHWIVRNSGGKHHLLTNTQHPPYFFADAQYIKEIRDVASELNFKIRVEREDNARFMQVSGIPYKITTQYPKQVGRFNRVLKERGVEIHEADIMYSWRVMVDAGIKAFVEIDPDNGTYRPYEPTAQEREAWKPKVIAWDIETTFSNEKPNPKHDRIVSIAVGDRFFCYENEAHTIMEAWDYMSEHDILLDWSGKDFDRPFFQARCAILRLPVNFKTVQCIDYMKTVIYLHREVNSIFFSLDEFGSRFLGIRKIPLEHPPHWYFENDQWDVLKEYNLRDTKIITKGDDLYKFSDVFIYIAEEAGVPITDLYFVSRIPLLIYLRASFNRHQRIILPCVPTFKEDVGSYVGGKVFTTAPGLHHNVFGMDLAASYVNIIRTFNCSPEMWNEETERFDQEEDGIVRLEIMRLQRLRAEYKKQLPKDQNDPMYKIWDIRQYAVKVMALTFYGELGRGPTRMSPQGSRLYIKDAAAYITRKGRELIMKAAEVAKEVFDALLVYGDTDSIYISIPIELSMDNKVFIVNLMNHIIGSINKIYARMLTEEGIADEHQTVEMEAQGYYPRFYITEAKKKYIYLLAYDGKTWYEPFKFGFVGMDFKRRETIPLIKKIQKKVCLDILNDKSIDEIVTFISKIRPKLLSGKLNKQLIFSYNLTKSPDKYKNNPPYVRAARKAVERGVQEVSNIEYVVTDSKRKKETVEPIIGEEIPYISRDAYHYYWGRVMSAMLNTLSPLMAPIELERKLLGRGELPF